MKTEQLFKDAKLREGVPRLDPKKVWGLFTYNEARKAKRFARMDDQASLRAMIVHALARSQKPFAFFVRDYQGKVATFEGSISEAVAAEKERIKVETVTPAGIIIPGADA